MAELILSPKYLLPPLALSVTGQVWAFNGKTIDFANLGNSEAIGADATDCPYILSASKDGSGNLTVTVLLPHGPDAAEATRFPDPITVSSDGPVALPAFCQGASAPPVIEAGTITVTWP